MGTIKNSIRSQISGDGLPTPISLAANTIEDLGNFVEYGTMIVTPLTSTNPETFSLLSGEACGPKGAYIFIENPSTNINTVHLYGLATLTAQAAISPFNGVQSFATVKPGESLVVPISARQKGIVVATPFGECTIKYYIADKGGAFGKSAIVRSDNGTNHTYFVLDAELGEALPSIGLPSYAADLGIDIATYTFDYADIINDKGYILRFYNSGNSNDQKRVFIDSRGNIVDTFDMDYGSFSYSETAMDSKLHTIIYEDGGHIYAKVFDGDNLFTHDIIGSGYDVWNDWDYVSADGAFILGVYDYQNNTDDYGVLSVIHGETYEINILNYNITGKYVDDCAVYGFGKFIFVSIWNDNTSEYETFEMRDTKGGILQTIDVMGNGYTNREWAFYGTNKLQLITYNNSLYYPTEYLYNYNGTTDNLVSTSYELSAGHPYRNFYSYSKWITDSIRPYDYTWNSGLYEPESAVIVYYNTIGYGPGQVSTLTTNMDFVYIMDGDTNYTTYTFADNDTKSIWLPNTGGGNYRFYPAKNSFVFSIVNSDGALQALTFTKAGQKTTTIATDYTALDGQSFAFKPVGDYVMYGWYLSNTDETIYTMLYDQGSKGVRKDNVSVAGSSLYPGVWRMRFNTLLLRSWNYSSPRNWYFNTGANKFVELTHGGDAYDSTRPYYPQHHFNKSVVTNGINDGNILLGPYFNTNISAAYENNNMRLLKKGLETKNVTLTETDGNWNLRLGSDMVAYWYQDPNDAYNLVVKIYDLNLDLKRTINLGMPDWNHTPEMIGERLYFSTDAAGLYKHYLVSSAGVAYMEANDTYQTETIFNDFYWFDFVY